MYYTYDVTMPTKIESVETYKERVYEIVHGQMKNVVMKERLTHPFFLILSPFFIPLSLIYLIICLCEIVVDTILLPLFCIPYIRGIAFFVSVIIWALGICVGTVSVIPLTYDVDYRPKQQPQSNAATNAESNLSDALFAMKFAEQVHSGIISKELNTAAELYARYGEFHRFDDEMGALYEEYEKVLAVGENTYGKVAFYSEKNRSALMLAMRKCTAVSVYYLFNISDLEIPKSKAIDALTQVLFEEICEENSLFESVSWFEVRVAFIERINKCLKKSLIFMKNCD